MKSSQTYANAVRMVNGAEPKKQCVFLYIDDSNMYLEGTRFYARYQNLHVKQDNRFRVNYAEFIRKVINGRKLTKARLYFSNPVEKAERWDGFHAELSKVIAVERFDRSIFGEEKEVDTSITADLVYDLWKFPCAKDDRVFIIVSGDRDFVPALRKVMEEGARAELYAYSQAIAGKLRDLQKENTDSLVIRDLGETLLAQKSIYLESKWHKMDQGYHSRVWIPSHKTMVFQFRAALSKVVPSLLAEYCTGCLKIPCYATAYLNYCLIVVGVSTCDGDGADRAALERLKSISFASPCAPPLISIMTVAEFVEHYALPEIHAVFAFEETEDSDEEYSDLLDEELETESDRTDSSFGKSGKKKKKKERKNDGFVLVTGKKRIAADAYECQHKFQCQNGVRCGNKHTEEELRFFRSRYPQKGCVHYKRCECSKTYCEFRDDRVLCAYAHGVKDAHCYGCGSVGQHWHEYCPNKVEKKVKTNRYNTPYDD